MLAGIPQSGIYLGNADRAGAARRVRRPAVPVLPRVRAAGPAAARAGLRAHAARSAWSSAPCRSSARTRSRPARRGRRGRAAEQALELRRRLLLQPGRGELGLRDAELPAAASTRPPGSTPAKADAFAASPASLKPLGAANALADQLGVQSTPTHPRRQARRRRCGRSQADPDRRRRLQVRPSTGRWGRREHDRRLRLVAIVLAVVGLGVAAYLTYIHYEGIKPVCGLGRRLREGPDLGVGRPRRRPGRAARPRRLRGDPRHALHRPRGGAHRRRAARRSSGFGFSAYLTYRELFSIDAICPWCVASAVIMTLLAIVTTARLLRARHRPTRCDTLRRVKKTSIYLEPELDEALARRAADEGLTKAEFIRRTLAGAVQSRSGRSRTSASSAARRPSVGATGTADRGVRRGLTVVLDTVRRRRALRRGRPRPRARRRAGSRRSTRTS